MSKIIGARRETLAGEVRSEIERWILAGELEPGQKLNEVALANVMGVSRGTVREAIRSLADSGLIVLVANRGAFVHQLTVDDICNLYDLRGAIFAMGCAAVARRMAGEWDEALIAALQKNLEDMRKAYDRDDRPAYYDLNIAFHDMILAGAQNPKAKGVYDGLVKEMHLFRRRGLSVSPNIAQSINEHANIVAAIAAGDSGAARRAATHHVESGLDRFLKTLSDGSTAEEHPKSDIARSN
ncbi:GntR family transcriptional regulator [Pelagibius litoralis]|uniref:GntR family transcriptional regulator n=1 Tax=Pelagibius litoralis TaxID=374515 RepID=UPI00197D7B43|nr:GntR family transcriptional regulator [Pelagibius litoralis]